MGFVSVELSDRSTDCQRDNNNNNNKVYLNCKMKLQIKPEIN